MVAEAVDHERTQRETYSYIIWLSLSAINKKKLDVQISTHRLSVELTYIFWNKRTHHLS